MTDWTSLLQSTIASKIKYTFPQSVKDKYPDIYFTTKDEELATPKFPTIKTKIKVMNEDGEDTEAETINAADVTLQIDVTTDKSESVAQSIAYEIVSILKEMHFNIKPFPTTTKEGDVYRSTMRARRTIGSKDKL